MNLKKEFLEFCKKKTFEINKDQIGIINNLNDYYKENFKKNLFLNFLKKKKK